MVKQIENTFSKPISELDITEDRIIELKDRTILTAQIETWKSKKKQSFQELWYNIKLSNIYIIGFPESKEGDKD